MNRTTRFRLSQVAGDRGLYQIKDVVGLTGLQPRTVSGLWKNTVKRVDLKTLDTLSEALDCSSLDLLEQVESTPKLKQKKNLATG